MKDEKYVGQRGPDKEPRQVNPKCLLNLKQFQKSELTESLNTNSIDWSKLGIILLLLLAIGFGIWLIWNRRKDSSDNTYSD